ncbi:sugar-binding domain-containing protein [Clostridium butyricum]|uniref:sugar-binding domain-containing protein n=1 Tax=Clostridium butyricum TaxID=1492 RepID=UPI0018AC0C3E|nr:sugar-binding domain-containing protein [Clostridium butyricum]MDB2155451.1 glycoside hydrolase family 2 TIM barrel-domain containing protein [Clostridium butyricum]
MEQINLHGQWKFKLDGNKAGITEKLFNKNFDDIIILPTTTSEAKKGILNTDVELGFLTDLYKFEGYAWFSKEVTFPKNDGEKYFELIIERTRITHVWIDEEYVGTENSLCTSHHYDITPHIKNKKHKITIMVDNTGYPTKGGHMTSPDTQTNWNGITGEISINITNKTRLSNIKFYPNIDKNTVKVTGNIKGKEVDTISLKVLDNEISFNKQSFSVKDCHFEFEYDMGGHVRLWSEYDPYLYKMLIQIEKNEKCINEETYSFGMLAFKASEKKFLINGKETFLRGKHDGLIFPITGYAPTDVESWIKVLKIAKEYGINHYRFHTCCPPKAAFEAADLVGIYMEPELPFWGTITTEEDENHDAAMQEYLIAEGFRILDEFGNHPSFVMMSLGNELWGSKEVLNSILKRYKDYDNRHLYVQGCNNFQWAPCILEEDDFFSGVRFSGDRLFRGSYAMCDAPQGHVQTKAPNTDYNYDEMIRPIAKEKNVAGQGGVKQIQYGTGVKEVLVSEEDEFIPKVPVISHEIGQYETFPDFNEIDKYTGVLRARNFETFKARLEEKELIDKAQLYFKASGKLAAQCYKDELETAFRSKELAGFQLLDLQDFSGQGTALVGVLDAFMDNKGIISADEWREFCSDCVLLGEFSKYVWNCDEIFKCSVKLSNYRDIINKDMCLKIELLDSKECIWNKEIELTRLLVGINDIADFEIQLPHYSTPEKATLKLSVGALNISNHYDIWIYPQVPEINTRADIIITDDISEVIEGISNKKKILYYPKNEENLNSIEGTYCTDFWCYPMFRSISEGMGKPIPVGTMGLLIDKNNPALKAFPCEFYSTPQWWDIVMNSRVSILDDVKVNPIVQMIDNFERNHRLGLIYEINIEDTDILVCTSPLDKIENSISAGWLKYSLIQYILSPDFKPEKSVDINSFKSIFSNQK